MQRGVGKTFAIYNIEEAKRYVKGKEEIPICFGMDLCGFSPHLWRGGYNHNSVFVLRLRFRVDSLLYLHFACDEAGDDWN